MTLETSLLQAHRIAVNYDGGIVSDIQKERNSTGALAKSRRRGRVGGAGGGRGIRSVVAAHFLLACEVITAKNLVSLFYEAVLRFGCQIRGASVDNKVEVDQS